MMTEQLPLGLDALLPLCPCGCGRRVPSGTRGQHPEYASPACRVRAHRARMGSDVSDFAVTPSQAPAEAQEPSTGYFRRCPVCSTGQHFPRCWLGSRPDVYIPGWVIDFGTCQCCGHRVPRAAS